MRPTQKGTKGKLPRPEGAISPKWKKKKNSKIQNKACASGYLLGLKVAGIPKTLELHQTVPTYPKPKKSHLAASAEPVVVNPDAGGAPQAADETSADPKNLPKYSCFSLLSDKL